MENLKFRTSLKCNGCVNAITPWLSNINEIKSWNVDLNSIDKVLEIEANEDISDQVIENIKKAGYEISRLPA
ncbi:MAG: heavy-metal-associated domain-containing protein [Bacteroidales bacterium]|nr:heavy-metal-associated domain-containing protein [Bacteroidales bacterium]